jgi:hypothetical protein
VAVEPDHVLGERQLQDDVPGAQVLQLGIEQPERVIVAGVEGGALAARVGLPGQ